MDQEYKSPLAKYKIDITQTVIEFVNSPEFNKFKSIMEQLYVAKLEEFHNEKEPQDILVGQKILNIYANLPQLLKLMEQNVISDRRDSKEKE